MPDDGALLMRYQQTLEIHHRLETVLRLIGIGEYSTPALAETIGVSIPTISRMVADLRKQGYDIRSERLKNGWRYTLAQSPKSANRETTAEAGYQRSAKGCH